MMSKEEAEKANVTDDRRRYLHVCPDKVNMAPPPDAERAGRRNGRQRRRLIAVAMAGCFSRWVFLQVVTRCFHAGKQLGVVAPRKTTHHSPSDASAAVHQPGAGSTSRPALRF